MQINTAFLVCAGLGSRMRPLTDSCPKPLLTIKKRPLLDYIFDHLRKTNVMKVTLNSHHLSDQIDHYVRSIPDFAITVSHEPALLETGGGLVKALDSLGKSPVFMINGDAFWIDNDGKDTLSDMEKFYDMYKMDILLCLIPVSRMNLTEAVGDYDLLPDGLLRRSKDKKGTHMFTGIRILDPAIMAGYKPEKFSFLTNMDEAEKNGRLYGFEMSGEWHHISTPEDLETINSNI